MSPTEGLKERIDRLLASVDPSSCDYLGMIAELVREKEASGIDWQGYVDKLYGKVYEEMICNNGPPRTRITFGTSGWRGILGKDLFCTSVAQVTQAIVEMYHDLGKRADLASALGVADVDEAKKRGCVVGFDNRFGGEIFAKVASWVLHRQGIRVMYAGETTTGVLSATVLQLGAAFSINFTPSHNPLEYGGLKFNAADAGPAASEITAFITDRARRLVDENRTPQAFSAREIIETPLENMVEHIDSLALWKKHVRDNSPIHGLQYDHIIERFSSDDDIAVVIDSVHGASRLHVAPLFDMSASSRLVHLRKEKDVTFGGVAPEPSSANMRQVVSALEQRPEKLKLGAIIDPDGDRIRFTDGEVEISMNQFGAMAYHFLHECKGKKGLVAKTVATSNFVNSIAAKLGEEVYEPKVGFKEFKPVINTALVCFEESDGISIIGHTPEKDGYIGLLLALDMIVTTGKNLGTYLDEIEEEFGYFYPERDGLEVFLKGQELITALDGLKKYSVGSVVDVDGKMQVIDEVIDIDGRKMIFEDGSWLMIRPSGTEPKVRFYVESRTPDGTRGLVRAARNMLEEVGVI